MSGNGKQPDEPEQPAIEIEADAPEAPASDANTSPVDAVASLNAEVEKLRGEKKDIYDRLLRTAADFDNFKKRTKKESGEAEDRGRQALLREILPALDNLERAVSHESANAAAVVEGVKLVIKQMHGALDKFGVRAFDSVGQAFDPAVHEALSQEETDTHPPGSIVREHQRGYMMGPRLLRPALVVVAKPKLPGDAEQPEGGGPTEQGGA